MHDLEQLIVDWRKELTRAQNVGPEALDELENHLRESVEELVKSGMPEADAFDRAVTQLGSPRNIAAEFHKINGATWLPVKVATGIAILSTLLLPIFFARSKKFGADLLLGTHVYIVTLAYLAVYLAGALGVCFVGQRCVSDFSASRAHSTRLANLILSGAAAGLTMVGAVLGAIWTRREWGRYWAWDPKETGAFCVVIWMLVLVCTHRIRRISVRTIQVMSILGSVIVSMAWFGADLWSSVHNYGKQGILWLLMVLVISNLAMFLIGLGPAGWLRLRKA